VGAGIAEIVGFFLVVIGLGLIVGAAALVSTTLAVLAAGVLVLFRGVVVVYVVNRQAATARANAPAAAGPVGR
jgi:hypothetical protein